MLEVGTPAEQERGSLTPIDFSLFLSKFVYTLINLFAFYFLVIVAEIVLSWLLVPRVWKQALNPCHISHTQHSEKIFGQVE